MFVHFLLFLGRPFLSLSFAYFELLHSDSLYTLISNFFLLIGRSKILFFFWRSIREISHGVFVSGQIRLLRAKYLFGLLLVYYCHLFLSYYTFDRWIFGKRSIFASFLSVFLSVFQIWLFTLNFIFLRGNILFWGVNKWQEGVDLDFDKFDIFFVVSLLEHVLIRVNFEQPAADLLSWIFTLL